MRGYQAGAVDYVPVPVVPELLRAKVRVFAELYRKTRQLEQLNAELEQRVAERTASLAQTNIELHKARASAEGSARAKADFLASMSHEMRTPMNGVLGMLELIEIDELPEDQARYLEIARDSAVGLLRVINDILDYSRIEAGSVELEATPCQPAKVVDQTVTLLSEGATQKGLTLHFESGGDVPEVVTGDPARLRQVLFNLIGNAVKFTERGEVRVQLGSRPMADGSPGLWFGVRDTGIGISKESQARIFTRFTQADRSTTRQYGGTGLGLAISKQLVELMGGEIGIDSTPGCGSLFWFSVPCSPASPAPVKAPQAESPDVKPGRPLRILVAEDNAVNQLFVTRLLARFGHSVEVAGTGAEAVAALERSVYDVVLMDIYMPEMDGITATKTIRRMQSATAKIPIVALTASAMAGDRERYLAAGMTDYVPKPIDSRALLAAIARALGARLGGGGGAAEVMA